MTRLGLAVDVSRCNGCYGCFLACRDEFCGNDHLPYAAAQPYSGHFWMRLLEYERGRYPKVKTACVAVPCMHCDDAPCVARHPDKVYSRPDGIVVIDPVKARGSKEILDSCPYRVIYWNEEESLPQKCNLCAHLLDRGWREPRCVEVCPTRALAFGDLDDPESEVSKRLAGGSAEVLHPEYGMQEKVCYLNLPRRFIAGSLVFGDSDKCACGVVVTLTGQGEQRQTTSNDFGDFEFEDLHKNREYVVRIRHPGYRGQDLQVRTQVDEYLGDIVLEKV